MQRLTIAEWREYGLAPAVKSDKQLEGLLLTAEGMATTRCFSAQNNDRLYTERMRFAIYTLARAISTSIAADPANNVVSESLEGYSYTKSEVDYVGDKVVVGALKLVDAACTGAAHSGVGAAVKGSAVRGCRCGRFYG
jgi:hypothetical protein